MCIRDRGGRVWSHGREPDVFSASHARAMIPPSRRWLTAAVIRGDDERGLATVLLHRLRSRPELLNQVICLMSRTQDAFVISVVRPVVRLIEGHVQHALSLI